MPLIATNPQTLVDAIVTDRFEVTRFLVHLGGQVITVWWQAGNPPVKTGETTLTIAQAQAILGDAGFAKTYEIIKSAVYAVMVGVGAFPKGRVI